MKPLIKVMLILGSIFALTFVLGRVFGILTVENVKHWLEVAASIDPLWLATTVILLLFIDLFVAVPTLTITILAGFFLGFPFGAAAAFIGISLAAFCGYLISRIWGGETNITAGSRSKGATRNGNYFSAQWANHDHSVSCSPNRSRSDCLYGRSNKDAFRSLCFVFHD